MTLKAFTPRFHDTVTIPVTGGRQGLRIVVTPEGILPSLIAYFLAPATRVRSSSWQSKVATAVGLFYDYTVAVPPLDDQAAGGRYLSQFVSAMEHGTVAADGTDSTSLRWPAANRRKVWETVHYLTGFSDFCEAEYGGLQINPKRKAGFGELMSKARASDRRNALSMFRHLRTGGDITFARDIEGGAGGEERSFVRSVVSRPLHRVAAKAPPSFPGRHLGKLLAEGFRIRKTGMVWEQYNIRDLLIVLLQRYGGLRASEPLHLYVGDVLADPDRPADELRGAGARVLLHHPEDGMARYRDERTGKIIQATRTEYLRSVWGMAPRSMEASTRLRAGWKDLMLDEGAPHWYANVYWSDDTAARAFFRLCQMYVRHVRPREARHPFLFCTHRGTERGSPYPLGQYHKALEAAMERIGVESLRSDGTTSHGLRHAYAQSLRAMGLGETVIQRCLHHKSVLSQTVYTQPGTSEIHAVLAEAQLRLKARDEQNGASGEECLISKGSRVQRVEGSSSGQVETNTSVLWPFLGESERSGGRAWADGRSRR